MISNACRSHSTGMRNLKKLGPCVQTCLRESLTRSETGSRFWLSYRGDPRKSIVNGPRRKCLLPVGVIKQSHVALLGLRHCASACLLMHSFPKPIPLQYPLLLTNAASLTAWKTSSRLSDNSSSHHFYIARSIHGTGSLV